MVEASLVNYAELGVLVIGVIIALQQLRDIKHTRKTELETRQAQLFMQIYNRFNSKAFVSQLNDLRFRWNITEFDDFMQKYGPFTNPEGWDSMASTTYFLEGIGVLMKKGLIDPEIVDDLMSGVIVSVWEKIEPSVQINLSC